MKPTTAAAGSAVIVMNTACEAELERALGYAFRGQAAAPEAREAWLAEVRGIAFSEFSAADVVRHPLVARIVDAYERAGWEPATRPRSS